MAKSVTVVFAGDTKDLQRAVGQVEQSTSGLSKTVKAAGLAAAAGVAVVGAAAVKFAKDSSAAYLEFKAGSAQTEAVLKSTGGAARVTTRDVDELTQALSRKAKIDDDEIRLGTNMLLTFTNIRNEVGKGNDVFNQANSVLVDMATAMGTDVKSGAVQLGKALNDPIAGISALSRVGIQFTDDQKALIKTLVESGDTMGAQKIILAELERQFGGSAAAAAGAKGPMADVALALDTVQTSVGKVLHENALPAFIKGLTGGKEGAVDLQAAAEDLGKWFEANGPKIAATAEDIGKAIRGLAGAIGDLVGWFNKLDKLDIFKPVSAKNTFSLENLFGIGPNPFKGKPGKAHGGPISGPTLVGENGPEIFDPHGSGSVLPRSSMAGRGGGGVTINVNAPVYGVDNLTETIRQALVRSGQLNTGTGL